MSAIIEPDQHNFRDSLSMLEADGSRKWIFAKQPKGAFYNKRTAATLIYLLIFFGLPWIQFHGEPLFMLNVVQRKFIVFGLHFGVQDLIVFGLAMLTFVVFIVLFTVVFGRLFCGWGCPQTIFMEMVFRRIEYWIDGDAQQQKILRKSEWTGNKIMKRALKYGIFFILSLAIANTFLSYIIGMPALEKIITEPLTEHIVGFMVLMIFTAVFFSVYAFLREQICIVACPYGRLQGVLLDKKSIVVAYDYKRGEPRGKVGINGVGDCIDCKACVAVCPTGIDIRNGTQLECINCTACIDACDEIMLKINRPTGLVRYASEENISKHRKLKLTPRILAYTGVLFSLLVILAFTFISHAVIDASILRTPGQFYQEHDDKTISNLYNFKVANKRNTPINIHFVLDHRSGRIEVIGQKEIIVPPGDEQQGQFFIYMPRGTIKEKNEKLEIDIYDSNKVIKTISTTFMAPVQ